MFKSYLIYLFNTSRIYKEPVLNDIRNPEEVNIHHTEVKYNQFVSSITKPYVLIFKIPMTEARVDLGPRTYYSITKPQNGNKLTKKKKTQLS